MKIITTIKEIRAALNQEKKSGKTIGFVPTMGYFHEGHLSLMRKAKGNCDVVVASIFVNPIQFGPSEDFETYPKNLKNDSKMAEEVGVNYLFLPSVEEMYSGECLAYVDVEKITKVLCGANRPGHFRGVATIVSKLFNIIQPDFVYFGEKDYQQLVAIKKMVDDLNFDIQVVGVPIVREKDGLAMSSRNKFLGLREREAALVLNKSLNLASEMVKNGEKDSIVIKKAMKRLIKKEPLVNLEYLSICDNIYLQELSKIEENVLIALAARVGKARLIDNVLIEGN